jgi:hypothetical protein
MAGFDTDNFMELSDSSILLVIITDNIHLKQYTFGVIIV